jgi:hypothetical protein
MASDNVASGSPLSSSVQKVEKKRSTLQSKLKLLGLPALPPEGQSQWRSLQLELARLA